VLPWGFPLTDYSCVRVVIPEEVVILDLQVHLHNLLIILSKDLWKENPRCGSLVRLTTLYLAESLLEEVCFSYKAYSEWLLMFVMNYSAN